MNEKLNWTKHLVIFCTALLGLTLMPAHSQDQEECNIKIIPEVTDVSCFGGDDGSILLEVENVKNPSFSWSNGQVSKDISMLKAGKYSVIVTGEQCTAEASVQVNEPEILSFEILSQEDVSCPGMSDGHVELIASGGTEPFAFAVDVPSSFVSANNFEGLEAGEHSFFVKDSRDCEATLSATIEEPLPQIIDLGEDIEIESGMEHTFEIDRNLKDCLWSTGQTTTKISFSREVNELTVETLFVDALDENNCPVLSNQITITIRPANLNPAQQTSDE